MAVAKWFGVLSTTESRNDVGIIKVRQGNLNSEIAEFQIIQNNKPYDLTGLTVYFCASFGLNLVEKSAVVINNTGGKIQYTFDDDSMQSVGRQKGYFSIKKEDSKIDSTQDFEFQVESSLMTRSIDGQSYIYKLSVLIKLLEDYAANGQENFDVWFESVKEILYGVDPGGNILRELIEARTTETGQTFDTLKARLNSFDAQLAQKANVSPVNIESYIQYNTEIGYWDGALLQALFENKNVKFPSGIFKFRSAWNITGLNNSIEGYSNELGGKTIAVFDGDGIFIETGARYANVKNVYLTNENGTGTALKFGKKTVSTELYSHFIDFKNVQTYGFDKGIEVETNSMLWNCRFDNMRVDHSNIGLVTNSASASNFGILFEKVYFNECVKVLDLKNFNGSFYGCNFGINSTNAISIDSNSYVNFDASCNIECDTLVTGTGNLFNMKARNVEFKNTTFYLRGETTVNVFGVFSSLFLLSFENIKFTYHSENKITSFWSASNCDAGRNGAIQFLSGSELLPRPTNFPQLYRSRYVDKDQNVLLNYHENNNYPLSKFGEVAMHQQKGIPIVKTNTDITDFLGNILDAVYPVKIGGNFYLDGGKATIPTGTGFTTISYKRAKAGIFILGPTTYNPSYPTKRYKVERNIDPTYYEKDTYAVIKAYEWDDTNKTWNNNITVPFDIQWFKISN